MVFFKVGRTYFQSGIGIYYYVIWNYKQTPERILFEINFDSVFVMSIDKAFTDRTMDNSSNNFLKVWVEH